MTAFEFVDELPQDGYKQGARPNPVLVKFADALRANPGKWAKWPLEAKTKSALNSIVWQINKGHRRLWSDLDFEARQIDGVLYVRHKGADK